MILDKINAGSELASLYICGITMGISFTDLTDILISKSMNAVSNIMKGNLFNEQEGMSKFDSAIDYVERGPRSLLNPIMKYEVAQETFVNAIKEAFPQLKTNIDDFLNLSKKEDDSEEIDPEDILSEELMNDQFFEAEFEQEDQEPGKNKNKNKGKYTTYKLRELFYSRNWNKNSFNTFISKCNEIEDTLPTSHLWFRLLEDLENWFSLKQIIDNDIIIKNKSIEEIPDVVYHYSDDVNLTEFKKIDNNYFTQFKNGTPNAIFFTDTQRPASGTLLANRAKRYAVKLHVDKVKYIYGTKEDLHNLGTDYTEQVNLAELEGYDAVRFIGIDDNQELNQNITVIFDPSKAEIIDDSLISENKVHEFNGNWTRHAVSMDTNSLYIFTDNTDRDSGKTLINPDSEYAKKYGKNKHYPTTTQAVIRGLDNAMPISTQRWYHDGAKGNSGRWTDDALEEFKQTIDAEIEAIKRKWDTGNYSRLVIGSEDGFFNTRISNITKERVPKIYDYLLIKLNELFEYVNNSQINNNILQQSLSIKRFDEAIKLYRHSTEMTTLSNYFKTNQGIPTDPAELIAIKLKFENMFNDLFSAKFSKNKKIKDIQLSKKIQVPRKNEDETTTLEGKSIAEIIEEIKKVFKNGMISMDDFFNNASYRNTIIYYYNLVKEFQNVPYIISTNSHYFGYLKTVNTLIKVFKRISKKFNIVLNNSESVLNELSIFKADQKQRVLKSITTYIDKKINNGWMQSTLDTFIIPEGVDIVDYSGKQFTTTAPTAIVLGTPWGNKAFKLYMETKVIPDLKNGVLRPGGKLNLGNKFINNLSPVAITDTYGNIETAYSIPVEVYPKTTEEELELHSYKESLQKLNIMYNNGYQSHSILNLLFLYNMIVYNGGNSTNALTNLFSDLFLGHSFSLFESYKNFVSDYDNSKVDMFIDMEELLAEATPISSRFTAQSTQIKDVDDSLKYKLFKKDKEGQYQEYTPMVVNQTVILNPNLSIVIQENKIQSINTNIGNITDFKSLLDDYNNTVTKDYQINDINDLLVTFKQGEETLIDIQLTNENINRIINNPC